ncbi:efflux RND transporter periplasmic adaptor subunit [Alteromonas macleodii]|uniref:CusB-like beta-barrel domain-containing protein n=1 Tax=Alteromonas macleodii TaxID=28108 RepID=A0A6T9Y4P4_ALTMA|nr:efflux RND transporter periplasmic adaptor subunit [Alteromonas macleodii]CAB9495197.1 conserved protein of unknown function [Alteromonas macleodii]
MKWANFYQQLFSYIAYISVVVGVTSSNSLYAEEVDKLRAVEIRPVVRGKSEKPIHSTGILIHNTRIRLAFNIGGLVEKIYVDKGDILQAGQLLARLDKREIVAKVNSRESALRTVESDWERDRNLFRQRLISESDYQHSKNRYETAVSDLNIAKFDQSLSTILAPHAGIVLERRIEENELVAAKQTIFIVSADQDGWLAQVQVPDYDVVKLNLGDEAKVSVGAYRGDIFTGKVSRISSQSDGNNGLFQVEVKIDEPIDSFRVGYLVSVDLFPQDENTYTYIDFDSLISVEDRKAIFFAYDEETQVVKRMKTAISFFTDDHIASLDNLQGVQHQVTRGASYLADGEKVLVRQY